MPSRAIVVVFGPDEPDRAKGTVMVRSLRLGLSLVSIGGLLLVGAACTGDRDGTPGAAPSDPAAPSAPTLLPADDTGDLGDSITSNNQPRMTGTIALVGPYARDAAHLARIGSGQPQGFSA